MLHMLSQVLKESSEEVASSKYVHTNLTNHLCLLGQQLTHPTQNHILCHLLCLPFCNPSGIHRSHHTKCQCCPDLSFHYHAPVFRLKEVSEILRARNLAKKTWPTMWHHTEADFVGGDLPITIGFPDKFPKLLESKNMVVSPENVELFLNIFEWGRSIERKWIFYWGRWCSAINFWPWRRREWRFSNPIIGKYELETHQTWGEHWGLFVTMQPKRESSASEISTKIFSAFFGQQVNRTDHWIFEKERCC